MVIIIIGSIKDREWAIKISQSLSNFGIKHRLHIASAHKTPEYLLTLLKKYEKNNNPKVYICVAGRSNALGGFVDANVSSPVINCPPQTEKYAGLDILSSLRMPSGVAPLTVLEIDQAALAAAKILAGGDKELKKRILNYQKGLKQKIIEEDEKVI